MAGQQCSAWQVIRWLAENVVTQAIVHSSVAAYKHFHMEG